MGRRQLLPLAGLVALALATALAVVGIASLAGSDEPALVETLPDDVLPDGPLAESGLPEEGIAAAGVLEPRIILFGETIRAHVDVLLDRRKVDPASVRVSPEFVPWEVVGQPSRTRRDDEASTLLRTTFTLRCTSSPCVPAHESSPREFDPARVTYVRAGGERRGDRRSLRVDFPLLLVYSRFAAARLERVTVATAIPWRADLDSLPPPTYRISLGVLIAALLGLAGGLVVAGGALVSLAVPRRSAEPASEPEPEPEPVVVLTPLEQALELLEDASRADGAEDRRRALELVAEVLDEEHPELAGAARTLAWSEGDPLVEQTSGLATRVRTTIDTHGDGQGNGRVA